MELSDSGFERYLRNIYHKVCIAVAISIIRTKPAHLDLQDHIDEIRKVFLKRWQDKSVIKSFENRITSYQRTRVFNQIKDLIPISTSQNNSDPESDEWFPDIDDINLPNVIDDYESSDDESTIVDNAEYMRALIKLKFAVNTRKTLNLKLNNSKTKFSTSRLEETHNSVCKTSTETDSGFDSLGRNIENVKQKTVSTCLLKYVTDSNDTDVLIKKYLEATFTYIRNSFKKTTICYNYWQGSMLEQIFSILREVAFDHSCAEAIVSFVDSVLEDIWSCEDINKHLECEFQTTLLNDLCSTLIITKAILETLIGKLRETTETIANTNPLLLNTSDQLLIEKVPHFIEMTSKLLIKLERFNKLNEKSSKNINNEELNDIKNLWKKSWINAEKKESNLDNIVFKNWKEIFEKLASCCLEFYPLISHMVCELVEIVNRFVIDCEDNIEPEVNKENTGNFWWLE